jgi:hypothetical protein
MQPGPQDFLRHSFLILALFFNKVADETRQHVFMAVQAGRRIESNMRAASLSCLKSVWLLFGVN